MSVDKSVHSRREALKCLPWAVVDLKNSLTKPKRRVSDLTRTAGLAVLASLGVMALPLGAEAAGGHPSPTSEQDEATVGNSADVVKLPAPLWDALGEFAEPPHSHRPVQVFNAVGAATQRGSDSHGLEKDEDTPTCHSIPTASVTANDAPQINILAPTLGRPLVSPLDIEVQFVPATTSNAAVRADTFRVCYVGFLTMDITKRITDRVTVSPNGLHVSGVQLPHGHHHLVMLISDQDGRIGRRHATFDIQ
jgi:hypothetical protein